LEWGWKGRTPPRLLALINRATMAKRIHTGQKVDTSGIYRVVASKEEITLIKGDRVPPVDKEAVKVVLVHKTRHNQKV